MHIIFFFSVCILSIVLVGLSVVAFVGDLSPLYIPSFVLLLNVVLLFYHRSNPPLFLFLSFAFIYFYVPKFYYLDLKSISAWPDYQDPLFFNVASILNLLFLTGLTFGLGRPNTLSRPIIELRASYPNAFLFYLFIFLQLIAVIFGMTGDTIFDVNGYGLGEVSKSSLHEYFILFTAASIIFSNRASFHYDFLTIILALVYSAKVIMYGGRVELVQLFLVFGFFYGWVFKIRWIWLLIILISASYFMSVYQFFRENPHLIYQPLAILEIKSIESDVLRSNFGDVYQASLRIVGLVHDGLVSFDVRIKSFLFVCFSFFSSIATVPDYYNLASYLQYVSGSGGGGLIAAFSFVWLSYPGPFIFGFFIGYLYKNVYTTKSLYFTIYAFIIFATFPRWFAYYPVAFVKMALVIPLFIIFIKSLIFLFPALRARSAN